MLKPVTLTMLAHIKTSTANGVPLQHYDSIIIGAGHNDLHEFDISDTVIQWLETLPEG